MRSNAEDMFLDGDSRDERIRNMIVLLEKDHPGSKYSLDKILRESLRQRDAFNEEEKTNVQAPEVLRESLRMEIILDGLHDFLEICWRAMVTQAKLKTKGTIEDPHRSPTDTSMVPYNPRPDNKR
jgi:hypothetical protein